MNFGRVSAEIWVCLFMLENTTTIENKKEISIALISSLPPGLRCSAASVPTNLRNLPFNELSA